MWARWSAEEPVGKGSAPRQNAIRFQNSAIHRNTCCEQVRLGSPCRVAQRFQRRRRGSAAPSSKWGHNPNLAGPDVPLYIYVRRPDRSGGAGHPVWVEKRQSPETSTVLGRLGFACLGQDAFGPHGSSGHTLRGAASSGAH